MDDKDFLEKIDKTIKNSINSALVMSNPSDLNPYYLIFLDFLNKTKNLSGILINFRNPSIKEKEVFIKRGIDTSKISFIDGITVTADFLPDDKDIYSLLNPNDLEGVKLGIESILSKKFKVEFLIIDLLDVLLYYNSIEKIHKMIEYLTKNTSELGYKLFVFASKENKALLDDVSPLFSEKIEV